MRYTIKLDGLDKAVDDLNELAQRAEKVHAAFDRIVDLIIQNERDLWSRNGGGGKARWQKNTKSTLARKVAKGLDKRPMRATGALEKSLTERGAAHQLIKIEHDSVTFGTKLFYGQFSQLAKNAERKRVFLRLQQKPARAIREEILTHVTGGFGGGSV
jgi:hypothetical protein